MFDLIGNEVEMVRYIMKKYIKASFDYEVEKYYVWSGGDHADSDGFYDFEDAYNFAMEVGADEIEKTCWHSEESYNNYEPADYFEVVWRQ